MRRRQNDGLYPTPELGMSVPQRRDAQRAVLQAYLNALHQRVNEFECYLVEEAGTWEELDDEMEDAEQHGSDQQLVEVTVVVPDREYLGPVDVKTLVDDLQEKVGQFERALHQAKFSNISSR